jgi:hypothetical protein
MAQSTKKSRQEGIVVEEIVALLTTRHGGSVTGGRFIAAE